MLVVQTVAQIDLKMIGHYLGLLTLEVLGFWAMVTIEGSSD